ncbi:MAG: hypothetical protein OXF57_00695, partial [Rhodospirillaceae bacterium]|nr:hypothetical protein [Rhodospirillaceae bacterium]
PQSGQGESDRRRRRCAGQLSIDSRSLKSLSAAGERRYDAIPYDRVAVRPKHVNPARRVDQDQESGAAALGLKLFRRHQILAGSGVAGEFGHAHAAVEVCDRADHGLALGPGPGEPDGILKLAIGNIDGRLHAARISVF